MSSASTSSSETSDSHSYPSSHVLRKRKRSQEAATSGSDDSEEESSDDDSDSDEVSSPNEADTLSDTPVLSRAEQRRQKKRQKVQVTLESGNPLKSSTNAEKDSKASSTGPQRQNSVWVGNLSYRTTPQSLREFFKDVGEITRVHMPMKASKGPTGAKENRGFAYVDFSSPDAKVIAITLSEQDYEGRRLLIKDGDDFTGRPAPPAESQVEGTKQPSSSATGHSRTAQKILAAQKQAPAPTLFLGNLSFESTEQSIREMLEAHRGVEPKKPAPNATGEETEEQGKTETKQVWIRKIRMGTFEDSGLCKGWAFVDFTSIEYATAVLVNPKNHHLDGRKLVVEYASPEAVRRGGGSARPKNDDSTAGTRDSTKRPRRGTRPDRPQTNSRALPPRESGVEDDGNTQTQKSPRFAVNGRDKGKERMRPRPGAALAQAARGSAMILPNQGRKTIF